MNILLKKFKDITLSVIPILVITMIMQIVIYFTKANSFNKVLLSNFLIGTIFLIIGLLLLLLGLDLSIVKIGETLGEKLINSKKILFILPIVFIIGAIITAAEPDLLILSTQLSNQSQTIINTYYLIIAISCGVGILLLFSVIRLIFNLDIKYSLYLLYIIILSLVLIILFKNENLISIAFDASSATTGAIIIPFILSFGVGLSKAKKDKRDNDSFGYVAFVTTGTIISTLIYLLIISEKNIPQVIIKSEFNNQIFMPFIYQSPNYLLQTTISIVPFVLLFIILNFTFLKLKKRELLKVFKGFIYIFVGLYLFLLAANIGYIDFAKYIGQEISSWHISIILLIAFIIGISITFTESSVHFFCKQVSIVTNSTLKKRIILIFLSIGVGLSLITVLLINYFKIPFSLVILPLYLLAIIFLLFIPALFQGLSFDAGSVASGPISATFVLSFIQGITIKNIKSISIGNLYGTLALISIMPVLTMEILGIIYYFKIKKRGINL